jgi:hypothetical protein
VGVNDWGDKSESDLPKICMSVDYSRAEFRPSSGISLFAKLKLPHLFINSEVGDQRRKND